MGWGEFVTSFSGLFQAGGVFPQEWLNKHINKKDMCLLFTTSCGSFALVTSVTLRRAQVSTDVENQSIVGAFKRGRAKRDGETHALLVQLFELQVEYGFMSSLKWVPTAANGVADAISRPSRESIIRLKADDFEILWDALGPFNIDLMASTASAQRVPGGSTEALPFFSQYGCEGSSGVDVLSQDVSKIPGTRETAFGYSFPPPVMAGHILQQMAEGNAHAMLLVPGMNAYWFPMAKQATVRFRVVAHQNQGGILEWLVRTGLSAGGSTPDGP